MKRIATTLTALGLAVGLTACSDKPATAETAAAPEAAPPVTAPAADMAGMKIEATAKMAKGTGTVTAVSADSVTIDHTPIPEAGWPAMTMAFKASPDIAKSVKAGDKVAFDLKLEGGGGEITAIKKQ
ncbi:MAG: copper-binding protein [Phenylobacterium sp.]|uniref:copper-binding protein n=1 Tax=Phenylobacterium sp. TaxID=1871053 RepID=UPI001A1E6A61|nr:copper-binding protein [Phenylobacterium sp.]MBJ7412218.1 copper-binding protein [Phenylobacterium sp.]